MSKYEICDLHGHFLPGMDDGSQSVEESLKMLDMAAEQGIGTMFATPHYYPVESVETFLERRQESWQRLQSAMAASGKVYPRICLGAEVAYRRGIGNAENLEKLCLGNSQYLLLELPFSPWERGMFRDISSLINVRGIIPVIAHIERYLSMQKQEELDRLLEQDVLLQMNASMLLDWKTRGRAKRLLKNGTVHLLGSDCHNMQTRIPNLGPALDYMDRRKQCAVLTALAGISDEIVLGATQN